MSLHITITCALLCALGKIIFIYNILKNTCARNFDEYWPRVWNKMDMVPFFTELNIIQGWDHYSGYLRGASPGIHGQDELRCCLLPPLAWMGLSYVVYRDQKNLPDSQKSPLIWSKNHHVLYSSIQTSTIYLNLEFLSPSLYLPFSSPAPTTINFVS